MKIMMRMVLTIALLTAGAAAGFVAGRNSGFSTGSEWSLMQAELLAREAGMFMPVRYEDGKFLLMVRQPQHWYRRARERADRDEREATREDREAGDLGKAVRLARNTSAAE